ncbi:MAG: hypothetical protein Q4D82_07835, partial [Neisseria sp.]|nr:hypothetical protein [Neisseria sp.]
MQTASKISLMTEQQTAPLNRCRLIVDSNSHRSDLLQSELPEEQGALFLESMLPQIRTVAMMFAAERHDFSQASPKMFTDEADWFAARILVLQARIFHLDISLRPMLETANRRAKAFACRHGLPFTPAKIRMSLYAGRPANLLIAECALATGHDEGFIANSRRLARELP